MNEMCEYPCVFASYMSENVEKGKESLHFALSNPLCVSLSLFLITSFSCCQSSLSSCPFVFNLKGAVFLTFLTLFFFCCHHICLLVSIYRHLFCFLSYFFIVWLSNNLHYVILWWQLEITAALPMTNFQTRALLLWPNLTTQEWVTTKIRPLILFDCDRPRQC